MLADRRGVRRRTRPGGASRLLALLAPGDGPAPSPLQHQPADTGRVPRAGNLGPSALLLSPSYLREVPGGGFREEKGSRNTS